MDMGVFLSPGQLYIEMIAQKLKALIPPETVHLGFGKG